MRRRDALELMDGQIPETENYAIENKNKGGYLYDSKGVYRANRESENVLKEQLSMQFRTLSLRGRFW